VRHSWTGGQYSLWRAAFALALWLPLDHRLEGYVVRLPAAALCLALGLGYRDRLVAWTIAATWWLAFRGKLGEASPGTWAVPAMLALHATTHGSPYGAIDGRGRPEPGGSWILPRWNLAARRLLVVAAAIAWLARGHREIPWAAAALLLVAAADPGWIPARRETGPTTVFYDGVCGLCHRFVRFLLAEDRTGTSFRYAALQGETFRGAYPEAVRLAYPDSIVVADPRRGTLLRSAATLGALERLGGAWRALALLAGLVPAALRDAVYDAVAAVRKKVFEEPVDVCPIVPAHLARQFDP
jgi:predicted DCC family thiol-disulfide oxidoreductase YuxK